MKRKSDPVKKAEHDRAYRAKHADILKQKKSEYYFANKERISTKIKQKYLANPGYYKSRSMNWKTKNKGRWNAKCMERYAAKLQRIPEWSKTDEFNQFVIEEFYNLARLRSEMTGVVHHVDHIIPLRGTTVSGLHIWYNLQILTASENCSKGNKV